MNPTPTTDTQRLRELLEAATPEEIKTITTHKCKVMVLTIHERGEKWHAEFLRESDAELYKALRNAAPALLDELEDLRQLKKEIDGDGLVPATRVQFLEDISSERDKLRRENEELKAKLR